jgi:hypothetical protein
MLAKELRGGAIMNTTNSMPRVLGWLIGGLSLVSLVRDLISLQLHQSIHFLISSYRTVVDQLFDFATGWINVPWFNVSGIERHFIIIMVICQSALLNVSRKYGNSYIFFALSVALFAIIDTIIFGIMPDSFVITPVFVAILILLFPLYVERSGDIRLEGYSSNLVGITIFFFTIALVNYVLTSV